jgi:hypothetical protein
MAFRVLFMLCLYRNEEVEVEEYERKTVRLV